MANVFSVLCSLDIYSGDQMEVNEMDGHVTRKKVINALF